MKNRNEDSGSIESRAATWLARRDAGMSAEEQVEFDRWRAASPQHASAVNEIAGVWGAFDFPPASDRAALLRAELAALDSRVRRRRLAWGAATALAAACLAVYLGVSRLPSRTSVTAAPVVSSARVSEPRKETLPDGSVVEFKRGAEISVAFSENTRLVVLRKGEAHFSVTKNPARPFIVKAGAVDVRAVGTAFAVDLGQSAVEVLVTEGRVRVASLPFVQTNGSKQPEAAPVPTVDPAASPEVAAGQRASIPLGATASRPSVADISDQEMGERMAWRVPRLDFSETTLQEAIAMFNRYNHRQLRAVDTAVTAMRITGVFRSDNVEGFVRALESGLGLKAKSEGNGILLSRAQ